MKITIFESASLISAWLLGMFTQSIVNDNAAIILCRIDLLELEKSLERFGRLLRDSSRSVNSDSQSIKEIDDILKVFNIHHAGLVIKNSELRDLIIHSLNIIQKGKRDATEPQNKSHVIGIDLINLWGDRNNRFYEPTKITNLQKFFHAGLIKRFYLNRKYKTISFWNILIKRQRD